MHIVFLCVANSARSQLAEGLARAMAPEGFVVYSAGSAPTSVRPEAIEVMSELGIDITGHRSKGMGEIPFDVVDVAVTLCAEEECPLLPGAVTHLDWALPDPAGGSEAERLQAFRDARDEIKRRLTAWFATV
jgi:protein-tyrosine-phosphatase